MTKALTLLPGRAAKGLRALAAEKSAYFTREEMALLVGKGLITPGHELTPWGREWVARDRQKSKVIFAGLKNHAVLHREKAARALALDGGLDDLAFNDVIAVYAPAALRPAGEGFDDIRARYKDGAVYSIALRALAMRKEAL